MSNQDEWKKPERYVPLPGMPAIPPQLQRDMRNKTVDEVARELKRLPFFMTDLKDGEEPDLDEDDTVGREQLEALKALAYDGEPEEIAGNFKSQGNEQYKLRRYKDAIIFYTKAISVEGLGEKGDDPEEGKKIKLASLANRAACNLELKNYRKCITDCKTVLSTLDSKHEKSIFRAGKALLAVDRVDESIDILEYGVKVVPESQSIPVLLQQAKERYERLKELEQKRRKAEELKQTKKLNLQAAIDAHGFTLLSSTHTDDGEGGSNYNSMFPTDTRIHLEDELNPASTLVVPIMFLYPVDMQSDIMQQADVSSTTINDFLQQLFGDELPPWAIPETGNSEYSNLKSLEVYAQTDSGGLVKVGKNSTLEKIFSLKKPVVPIIDGVPRLYVVPKTKSKEWLGTWNKDHARYLLYGK